MAIELKSLPFEIQELEPHMSRQTLEFHYGKHHKNYVDTLNKLIAGTVFDEENLEQIVCESHDTDQVRIFNNAAQVWNHDFFWHCLRSPETHRQPSQEFMGLIESSFRTYENFKSRFNQAALDIFGSGWAWLVKENDRRLSIATYSNTGTPLMEGKIPLLTCDVWEHAYYLDHKNARGEYLNGFWNLVNWEFAEKNFLEAPVSPNTSRQVPPQPQAPSFYDELH